MGSEVFLYGYGLVCISMLVYNMIYNLYSRGNNRRLEKHTTKLSRRVRKQFQYLMGNQEMESSHLLFIKRKLSKITYLLAFEHFLEEEGEQEEKTAYLQRLRPVFQQLAKVYSKRESTQTAYFCYFLTRHGKELNSEELRRDIVSYMARDSLYCRVHVLKALCAFGDGKNVAEALLLMEQKRGAELHEKVIVEILLLFSGDAAGLIEELWQNLPRFSLRVQRALLDYIRFKSGAYSERMYAIMEDPQADKELRFAAIRYFGKYPDPRAREALLRFVGDLNSLRWEYTAIAASSLARYSGEDVVKALIRAMHSANWYVRYNASASLEAHGLSYEELLDVMNGDDRYARDMLAYRLEIRQMIEERRLARS